ncbi:gliding motility protein GldN [Pedobacter sp. SYSU D00535]|uniref:type IX secretion system ring protein PorN/GldN n=1 Tax=Pedobacter sp. SYSU D00535 TaxID=2810308 RepID=UPI001A95685B|nr:gliding motility protein GldN [Pedobacter sp. SYSU D00535]
MKRYIYTTLAVVASLTANAQLKPDTVVAASQTNLSMSSSTAVQAAPTANTPMKPVDGFYNYSVLGNATPFNYPYINPNNVRFYKRLWRDIDLSDPQNQILATPGNTLIEMIIEGIKAGKITAYDPSDDSFKHPLKGDEAFRKMSDSVLVPIFDGDGNQIDAKMMANDFSPEKITKFRIKEDIFFDKQRSKVETRIIGIAPIMKVTSGEVQMGETPAFWLYFPECRNVFVTKDISDPDRNIFDMSMDDVFLQRKFASRIIRESNTSGQRIADYAQDEAEQEKEAKRIEENIEDYKKKIWGYNKKD